MNPILLGASEYESRTVAVTIDATGQAQAGSVASSTVLLSVQPMRWEEKVQLLPEGMRTRRAFKAYGSAAVTLQPARPEDGRRADQVLVDGIWCDVHGRDEYVARLTDPALNHVKILLVEVGR